MSDEEAEFQVGGIFARCQIAETWYWWVLWDDPYAQRYRDDHWQPMASFLDDDGVATAVWLAFENIFPREWGNVSLLPRLRARVDFPFDFYGHPQEEVRFRVQVVDHRGPRA